MEGDQRKQTNDDAETDRWIDVLSGRVSADMRSRPDREAAQVRSLVVKTPSREVGSERVMALKERILDAAACRKAWYRSAPVAIAAGIAVLAIGVTIGTQFIDDRKHPSAAHSVSIFERSEPRTVVPERRKTITRYVASPDVAARELTALLEANGIKGARLQLTSAPNISRLSVTLSGEEALRLGALEESLGIHLQAGYNECEFRLRQ